MGRTYEESKHIIVFRKGVMFNLPLYATDSSGFESLLTPAELQRQIELILHHTDEEPVYNPAIFTTLTRPEWTREREKLLMRAQNRESLKQVERALFHVVLEDTSPKNLSEECHSNLCGNGFNRWYDKSYVMTIYANGLTGGNVEHTSVDATLPSTIRCLLHLESSGTSMSLKPNLLLFVKRNIFNNQAMPCQSRQLHANVPSVGVL